MMNNVREHVEPKTEEKRRVKELRAGTLFRAKYLGTNGLWIRSDDAHAVAMRLRDGFLSTVGDREVLSVVIGPVTLTPELVTEVTCDGS